MTDPFNHFFRQASEGEENAKWWTEKLAELKPLATIPQISLLSTFLKNKRASDRWLGTEITLKRLDLELRKWIADEKRDNLLVADEYRVFLARTTAALLERAVKGQVAINERQGKSLLAVLDTIGLNCLVPKGMVFGAEAEKAAAEASKPTGKKGKPAKKGAEKENGNGKDKDKEESVKLSFSFVKLISGGEPVHEYMRLVEDPIEFQLRVSTGQLPY